MLHEAVYARKQAPAPSWGCFETIDADVVLLVPSKSLVCPSIAHFQSFFSLDVESLSDRINFVNDFTPEEEEAVKAEDAWAYRVFCLPHLANLPT